MCESERAPSLEFAEILELKDVLFRVGVWLGKEEFTICCHQFKRGSFAEQVFRVFNTRRAIHTFTQKIIAALPRGLRPKDREPSEAGLEQQARNAFVALYERGFEIVNPQKLNSRQENKDAYEFLIKLGEDGLKRTLVRLYPPENLLPDEKDGGLLNYLDQIEDECIVVIPSFGILDAIPSAKGYAFYQVTPDPETPVVKLNSEIPITGGDYWRNFPEC